MEHHIYFDQEELKLHLLDQRMLPTQESTVVCGTTQEVIKALQAMVVRGAPAIGVTGAWGCVLAACDVAAGLEKDARESATDLVWLDSLGALLTSIRQARPTAVNLEWAVKRMVQVWDLYEPLSIEELIRLWASEAMSIQQEDKVFNQRIGSYGAVLLESGDTVMTHCNAGALATAGFGTALGVIYSAKEKGKEIKVIANETRPFLQGARLTAYELQQAGIPVTVACDNACALLMQRGMVQKVVVGADRIAANGDTANKIGTYGIALLAKAHNIPFYVAAPLSTIDAKIPSGDHIPIEERPALEVTHVGGVQITPDDVPVFNFAFDVTPNELISGIITEAGVLQEPYTASIAKVKPR